MCVAAWLHGLEMQQYEPVSRNSATMLNLEDLGMSQIEPRRRPLVAIAAPASDGPVVASPIENRAGELSE